MFKHVTRSFGLGTAAASAMQASRNNDLDIDDFAAAAAMIANILARFPHPGAQVLAKLFALYALSPFFNEFGRYLGEPSGI